MEAKKIAFGGIMVALSTLILYFSAIIPINTIAILTVASSIIPICIIRTNLQTSIIVYLASSILSFFITPINIAILYSLFFGFYGIIKYWIEKKQNITIETIFKLLYFNIVFIIGFIIMEKILGLSLTTGIEQILNRFFSNGRTVISYMLIWFVGQIVFIIYDYALTEIITFYMEKIHKK